MKLLAALATVLLATQADLPATRSETLTLYIGGARAGSLLSIDEPLPDGGWKLTRTAHMEIRRGAGQTLKLDSTSISELNADLSPRRFSYVRDEAAGRMANEGTVRCKASRCVLTVKTTLGGATREKKVDLPDGASFATAAELRARRNLKAGAQWSGQAIVEELADLQPASYSIAAEGKGFLIRSSMAGVESLDHLDASGRTLKTQIPALNALALPDGVAPAAGKGSTTLDVLARSTWKGPELPDGVKTVRFVLTTQQGDVSAIPEDRRQRVVSRKPGRVVVEVVRAPAGMPEVLSAADRAKALAPTPYEPIQDVRIVVAAKRARGDARTDREVIRNVTAFVKRHVRDKNLSRAYAPATVTLETRVGDCTEHSVLASALLRANGIPTRLADGVIWFDDNLGYHEWVEAYLDGEGWVPIDPTFGEAEAGPNRVKFITGSSEPSDLMTMGLSAAQAFRGLTVSVEKYQ